MIELIRARISDKADVLAMYEAVKGAPFCTWNEYYPTGEDIDIDLASDTLFLMKENGITVGALSVAAEEELASLPFWQFPCPAAELARVVVSPACRGRGIALDGVTALEKHLAAGGIRSLRLLVAVRNIPAFKTYQKAGFSVRDRVEMYGNTYYACEKMLDAE